MEYFEAVHDCGCCIAKMAFRSGESAVAAFNAALGDKGLRMGVTIIDDEGTLHEGIDAFYGVAPASRETMREIRAQKKALKRGPGRKKRKVHGE